jgi:hypothetical protein
MAFQWAAAGECLRPLEARRVLAFKGGWIGWQIEHRHDLITTKWIKHVCPVKTMTHSAHRFSAMLCGIVIFTPRHCRQLGSENAAGTNL